MAILKEYRKESSLSQQAVADYLGMARETYCRMEGSGDMPSLAVADKLAALYMCTIYDLWPELDSKRHHDFAIKMARADGKNDALESVIRTASAYSGRGIDEFC